MSETTDAYDHLIGLRRDLHRHPEPAWREFYTTARIVEEVERIGVDELFVGRDALDGDRGAVPDEEEIEHWLVRAREAGADPDVLERLDGGYTGAVAVLEKGEGPTVGLRVDIDALPRTEADDPEHVPAAEGFRSGTGAMHACGHDAHTAIGVGVLEAVKDSDFSGTLKVFFQPAEEVIGGGGPMAESGHLDDLDYLLAVHVGLEHPTGEVVAAVDGFLAVSHLDATFHGESAHAGGQPNRGRNAIQAAATAIQNLYAIPRHEDGATRVNAGVVRGGTAANIVAEETTIEGEVRGETTALMEYVQERAEDVLQAAADMHRCTVDVDHGSHAPSAESDGALASVVADAARGVSGVDSVVDRDELGGSEDATFMMRRVQERGGLATYVGIGTDHPGGHHTATFDVDEESIGIGVEVLAEAILALPERRP